MQLLYTRLVANHNTVRLPYNRLGYNGYSINTDILDPAECLLKWTALDFRFPVPTLWTRWIRLGP